MTPPRPTLQDRICAALELAMFAGGVSLLAVVLADMALAALTAAPGGAF